MYKLIFNLAIRLWRKIKTFETNAIACNIVKSITFFRGLFLTKICFKIVKEKQIRKFFE